MRERTLPLLLLCACTLGSAEAQETTTPAEATSPFSILESDAPDADVLESSDEPTLPLSAYWPDRPKNRWAFTVTDLASPLPADESSARVDPEISETADAPEAEGLEPGSADDASEGEVVETVCPIDREWVLGYERSNLDANDDTEPSKADSLLFFDDPQPAGFDRVARPRYGDGGTMRAFTVEVGQGLVLHELEDESGTFRLSPPITLLPPDLSAAGRFRTQARFRYDPAFGPSDDGTVSVELEIGEPQRIRTTVGTLDDVVPISWLEHFVGAGGLEIVRRLDVWLAQGVGPIRRYVIEVSHDTRESDCEASAWDAVLEDAMIDDVPIGD